MSEDWVPRGALQHAIDQAVASGLAELDDLEKHVGTLLADLRSADASARNGADPHAGEFESGVRTHFEQHRAKLASFNVAFFGRTGAGKSTLVSAFGELDGGYVSPGESDWTTSVSEVRWHGCQLWDTPGINGWGRTETRADLEETARRAVEIADVVMLCFDSQSQQASEFSKVAAWVRAYGKPAVAVLNVRNLRWRHPAKVPNQAARQSLSRGVREHVDNIRSELGKIDLADTPVVAIQSRRALFARAATPFNGPAKANFVSDREKFGVEYLARWSNFETLERLVTLSIVEGGAELRLTSLREGLREMLKARSREIGRATEVTDAEIAEADVRVKMLLDSLGYVESESRVEHLGAEGARLLTEIEALRGSRYESAVDGAFSRYLKHLVKSHLSPLREHSTGQSDSLVDLSFGEGRAIDGDEFVAYVYSIPDMEAARDEIVKAVSVYLLREIELIHGESAETLDIGSVDHASLDGDAGGTASRIALALRGGGLAVGAAGGAMMIPAVANIWNPVGWGGTAAAIALAAVGQIGKFFGDRAASDSEKQKAAAHAEATRSSRAAVDQTFDRMEADIQRRAIAAAWVSAGPELLELLGRLHRLHVRREALAESGASLGSAANSIPAAPNQRRIMVGAEERLLAEFAASRTLADEPIPHAVLSRQLWLGEDWLAESLADQDMTLDPDVAVALSRRAEDERAELRWALARAWDARSVEDMSNVLRTINASMSSDERVRAAIQQTSEPAVTKPAVVVLGDYSSGKSSLIRRLLVEMGGQIPPELRVRATATTNTVNRYDLGHIHLIDTPGFQSGNADHDEQAVAAASEASLVVVVLHVNLLIGESALLEAIANGTERSVALGDRTIYLINRADELGADPIAAPEEFVLLKRRKKRELVEALTSRGLNVDLRQVHVLAGDPFGEIGSRSDVTRSDFDHHRAWDGIEPFVRTLDTFSAAQGRAAITRTALARVVHQLLDANIRLRSEAAELREAVDQNSSVLQTIENSIADARTLEASLREEARRVVWRYADAARAAVRELSAEELERTVNTWVADAKLESDINRFLRDAQSEIEDWRRRSKSNIEREIEAAQFAASVPADGDRFEAGSTTPVDAAGAGVLAGAARGGADVVKLVANRDTVYAVGKAIGVKFKPWGAVNAAGRIGKAAPVLAVAGVALDVYSIWRSETGQGKLRDQRIDAERTVVEAADQLVGSIVSGDGMPVNVLSEFGKLLVENRDTLVASRASVRSAVDDVQRRLETIDSLLTLAAPFTEFGGK